MNRFAACSTMLAGASVALVLLASTTALAASSASAPDNAPVAVAQLEAARVPAPAAMPADEFPAYQRGVRAAAAESNEALRRYIWRTRMIYNFYFPNYVVKE